MVIVVKYCRRYAALRLWVATLRSRRQRSPSAANTPCGAISSMTVADTALRRKSSGRRRSTASTSTGSAVATTGRLSR
jgi:hypothetical protein